MSQFVKVLEQVARYYLGPKTYRKCVHFSRREAARCGGWKGQSPHTHGGEGGVPWVTQVEPHREGTDSFPYTQLDTEGLVSEGNPDPGV